MVYFSLMSCFAVMHQTKLATIGPLLMNVIWSVHSLYSTAAKRYSFGEMITHFCPSLRHYASLSHNYGKWTNPAILYLIERYLH